MVSFRRAHKDLDGRKVVARHPTTAVATNSSFTEWDKTFGGARLCAAIADRITFRCTLIQTGTESYRYQAAQESLLATTN